MTETKHLSTFAKAMRKSYSSSLAGSKATLKTNVLQSSKLKPFTLEERTGKQQKEN